MVGRQRSLTTPKAVPKRTARPVRPRRTPTLKDKVARQGRAETTPGKGNAARAPDRALKVAMQGAPGLERGIFTLTDPREVARVLKRSADRSGRPDSQRFALMLLAYYTQRSPEPSAVDRERFTEVRHELHKLYGSVPPKRRPAGKAKRAA